MAFGDLSGRARTNPYSPQAFAVCDSCGTFYNRVSLSFQYEYAGDALRNTGFLMCYRCLSKPQQQLRSILLPLDPVPIINPRPEQFAFISNLNGFLQFVGPQGETITNPIPTNLDPTDPIQIKAAVLASSQTGWGLPQPTLVDHSGSIATASVAQVAIPANPDRQYMLLFNPTDLFLAAAQNAAPVLTIPTSVFLGQNLYAPTIPEETRTITVGTGSGMLQNAGATPPASVWLGDIYVLGFTAGQPFFAWEG